MIEQVIPWLCLTGMLVALLGVAWLVEDLVMGLVKECWKGKGR